jgi:hypothetical protein
MWQGQGLVFCSMCSIVILSSVLRAEKPASDMTRTESLERCNLHRQEGSSLDLAAAWSFDSNGSPLVAMHVSRSARLSMACVILASDSIRFFFFDIESSSNQQQVPVCDD